MKFSMKDSCLSMSSGESGTSVAAGVGGGFGVLVAVGVGRGPGAGVAAGVGDGMLGMALEAGAVLGVAVGEGVEDVNRVCETAVGPSATLGVAVGASRCICRCCGSVLGCEQAVAPIANISKA